MTNINAPQLEKMADLFEKAAVLIRQAIEKGRTIKIRYDGDCDGIMSALILKKSIEHTAVKTQLSLRCKQSRGAVYSEDDLQEDKATIPANSLVILLDHGANEESKEFVGMLAQFVEVMVVDHHPPSKDNYIQHLVSPFVVNATEPSSYNTGLLAFEISKILAPQLEKQLLPFCLYSMQADASSFRSKTFFPEAVVVDYLAVKASDPYSLEFYEKTLADKHLVKELYREEETKMQEALEKALRKARVKQGKFQVVTCNVSSIARKRGYPSIGKLHNKIQEHFSKNGSEPTASIVYTRDRLSFRATHSAAALGFSANRIIDKLKEEYGKHGFTGGGHNVAASTKFPKEYGKEIINKAIEMVVENGKNNSTEL